MSRPDASDAVDQVGAAAAEAGFALVGVASGRPVSRALARLEAWTAAGHHADMGWMARNPPERADPRTLLESVRSVVTLAVACGAPTRDFDAQARYGRVARYAWGRDYHDLVTQRLEALADVFLAVLPGVTKTRVACDHSPLLERAFASRAGLGFCGKNTCLLVPRHGSAFLLGEILLDADLPETASVPGHCGTCTACLDACPTRAFPAPHVLDARRCVSFLTIEHKGVVPRDLRPALGAWVFGCDDCQSVCPFNRWAGPAAWPELEAAAGVGERLDLETLLAVPDDAAFRLRFAGTPLLRPKRRGLLRNAAIVARNVGATCTARLLRRLAADDPEPVLRVHALWALERLDPAAARRLAERALVRDPDESVRGEARAVLGGEDA